MEIRLKECRKAAGFRSARAFAEHIGMPTSTYTKYEQGERQMSLEVAWQIADVLRIPIDELIAKP